MLRDAELLTQPQYLNGAADVFVRYGVVKRIAVSRVGRVEDGIGAGSTRVRNGGPH